MFAPKYISVVNPSGNILNEIALLREQLEHDLVLEDSQRAESLSLALCSLESIARGLGSHVPALVLVARLRRLLQDHYNPAYSRLWTLNYVLKDLKSLEEISLEPEDRKPDDRARSAA